MLASKTGMMIFGMAAILALSGVGLAAHQKAKSKSPCSMRIQPATATCLKDKAPEVRYGYNISSQKCEQYWYTSCSANENNFKTLADCFRKCKPDSQCLKPYEKPSMTWLPFSSSYYFDIEKAECKQEKSMRSPSAGPRRNRFTTEEDCKRWCMPLKIEIVHGSYGRK
uniref:Pancreatic trypsin inhibitor n=1 Tax=Rhipicephalus appendiculatus TaxID=34631 RepID=A0A131YUQ7_RHIAP